MTSLFLNMTAKTLVFVCLFRGFCVCFLKWSTLFYRLFSMWNISSAYTNHSVGCVKGFLHTKTWKRWLQLYKETYKVIVQTLMRPVTESDNQAATAVPLCWFSSLNAHKCLCFNIWFIIQYILAVCWQQSQRLSKVLPKRWSFVYQVPEVEQAWQLDEQWINRLHAH